MVVLFMHACSCCTLRKGKSEFSCRQLRSKVSERKCRKCNDSTKKIRDAVSNWHHEFRESSEDSNYKVLWTLLLNGMRLRAKYLTFLTLGNCDFCRIQDRVKREDRDSDDLECAHTVSVCHLFGLQLCASCHSTYSSEFFSYMLAKHDGVISVNFFVMIVRMIDPEFNAKNLMVRRSASEHKPAYYQDGWQLRDDYCIAIDSDDVLNTNIPVLLPGDGATSEVTVKTNKLEEFCEGNCINPNLLLKVWEILVETSL